MANLLELYAAHHGKVSDKWELYLHVYDDILNGRRADPCRLLEIGVQNGGSLELWAKYFANAKVIVGCDIDTECSRLFFDDPRIHLIVADINSKEARAHVTDISDSYDIIIDDGSHVPSDIIEAFLNFFPLLSPGGIYVVEDMHCDYLESYSGGIQEQRTASRFFFCLVQLMHQSYWSTKLEPEVLASPFVADGNLPDFLKEQWIQSITFLDSLVVVRRSTCRRCGYIR